MTFPFPATAVAVPEHFLISGNRATNTLVHIIFQFMSSSLLCDNKVDFYHLKSSLQEPITSPPDSGNHFSVCACVFTDIFPLRINLISPLLMTGAPESLGKDDLGNLNQTEIVL